MNDTFGPKRVGVRRGCRKLHTEELCDLYSSPTLAPKLSVFNHI
jgi:hypothetical protein